MGLIMEEILYPPTEPYREGRLKVSALHTLHFEECGTATGLPVLFLHGGPGAGTDPRYRQFFDPTRYRVVLFDQRGCGKSTPHACLDDNTTWELVSDIEKLRQHLGVERWLLFGGSWGAALALAYAETHANRVTGLILRGIFTLRPEELHWFYQEGASYVFPDHWEDFLAPVPKTDRDNIIDAYHRLLTSKDETTRLAAAKAWTRWEKATSNLRIDDDDLKEADKPEYALAFARIENHYFLYNGFFDPVDQLLANCSRIREIPCTIVQGRYDIVCPMKTAWDFHSNWPEAEFKVAPTSGHSTFEPEISRLLVEATDLFSRIRSLRK